MKVAILGCGPAGLLAAHAVARSGHEPVIFSRKVKSPINGAQFLHRPIQGATMDDEKFIVTFIKIGTEQGYKQRIYGLDPDAVSSWGNYKDAEKVQAWPLVQTYDRLWNNYGHLIVDRVLDPDSLQGIYDEFEVVISSVPRPVLNGGEILGSYVDVFILPGDSGGWTLRDNTVIYNGIENPADFRYRASNIQGVSSAEYTVEVPGSVRVRKPIKWLGSNKHPEILKVGRYGRWDKSQLAHHAYSDTIKWLNPDLGAM